jgi:hypothetical protein
LSAEVVIAHDVPERLGELVTAIEGARISACGFTSPIEAMNAVETDGLCSVLVTRIDFGPGKPHGISIALALKVKKRTLKVIFLGRPEYQVYAEEHGVFLPAMQSRRSFSQAFENALI